MKGTESQGVYAASFTGGSREACHCMGKSSSSRLDWVGLYGQEFSTQMHPVWDQKYVDKEGGPGVSRL
jgi:hypothetical protein